MKMNEKEIIICCLMIVTILIFTLILSGDYQVEKLLKETKKIVENEKFHGKTFIIKGNKIYESEKKEYREKLGMLGLADGYLHVDKDGEVALQLFLNGLCYTKENHSGKINKQIGSCFNRVENYESVKKEQVFVTKKAGYYEFELWGADGGSQANDDEKYKEVYKKNTGKGAYTKGTIYLDKDEIIYVYVGSKGEDGQKIKDYQRITPFGHYSVGGKGGYNGGGNGHDDPEQEAGGGGGGATDIRLQGGLWDDFESLKSRIMVAGGGGGMSRYYFYSNTPYAGSGASGSGGELIGKDGRVKIENKDRYGYGATQTSGYKFGKGEAGSLCMTTINGLGGGAGGYYGSKSGYCNKLDWAPSNGAGGGSSYVSGCKGCNSIMKNSIETNIKHTNNNKHFSGKVFSNIVMMSGEKEIISPKDGKYNTYKKGDGYARITYISNFK